MVNKTLEKPELVVVSSRGQLVLPKMTRMDLGIETGSVLAVSEIPEKEIIILKKVDIPNIELEWNELHSWGVNFAKMHNLTKEDLKDSIKKADKRRK